MDRKVVSDGETRNRFPYGFLRHLFHEERRHAAAKPYRRRIALQSNAAKLGIGTFPKSRLGPPQTGVVERLGGHFLQAQHGRIPSRDLPFYGDLFLRLAAWRQIFVLS